MKNKKTVCTVLTVLISLSLTSVSHAAGTASVASGVVVTSSSTAGGAAATYNSKMSKEAAKEAAKDILKKYFDTDIDETKYQTNVDLRPDYAPSPDGQNLIWQIAWDYHEEDKDVHINVAVDDASGRVLNVNNMTFVHSNTAQVAVLTEDQAREAGENFLKKINPKEFSQCRLVDNDINNGLRGDATEYNFVYNRIVNDCPFLGDSLNVGVDSITGKIRSYGFRWSNSEIPGKDGIISEQDAIKDFRDNLKLKLQYIPCRDEYGYDYGNSDIKLAYVLDTAGGINIDAKGGNLVDYNGAADTDKKIKDLDESQKNLFLSCFKPVEKSAVKMDSTSAEVIMKQIVKDIYGDGYDIQSTGYQTSDNGYGLKVNGWTGQFVKKDSSMRPSDQGQITIDSSTGQLISINKFNPMEQFAESYDSSQAKLTWEQAYDKAVQIIEKYFPDRVKDINTEQTYTQDIAYYNNVPQIGRFYRFNFNRVINGVPYQYDNISLSFDAKTGEIDNMNSSWTGDLKVPSTEGIISGEKAGEIFFDKYVPNLAYTNVNTSKDMNKPAMEVKLVYSILGGTTYNPINNVDAFTGKFIDYNGQEVDGNAASFKTKIKGSPAEKELGILAVQGIINTKNFDLNKQVTRADFIKMLVNAKGYRSYMVNTTTELKINYGGTEGDEMYKYLQAAVFYKILDNSGEFKGDEIITRQEMARDIVKLLGYDDIAKAEGIFTLPYNDAADITDNNLGYVAIFKGLGFAADTDTKFRPQEPVKIEDAAVSIYKALSRIRNN